MTHNCDLSVLVKTVEVTISRAHFFRLLRLNNITAGSSTKGLEQIPDDSREQEERKEGKKDGASGDVRSLQGGVLSRERERKKRVRLGCV